MGVNPPLLLFRSSVFSAEETEQLHCQATRTKKRFPATVKIKPLFGKASWDEQKATKPLILISMNYHTCLICVFPYRTCWHEILQCT